MKNKTAKKNWQQGDVFGKKLNEFPSGPRKVIAKKHIILAEGEATGHAHVIDDDEAELIQIGEKILLNLAQSAVLQHEDHGPIPLSPGIWDIGRVREFDWLQQMERKVTD